MADCSAGDCAIRSNGRLALMALRNLLPIVEAIRVGGITTLAGIAQVLNNRGIDTPRGGQWYPSSVRNLLARGVV